FDTWLDDLQLYLLSDSRDSVLLFGFTSGASLAPPATDNSATRSQWLTGDAAARLVVRNHLPLAKRAHFGQHKTAKALDHFLALDPTDPTVDLLEKHLLAAETSVVVVGAARGTSRTPFFEGCSPSPLAPTYASAAAVDILGAEDVGAASAFSGKRRSSKGKGGKSDGGGNGGGGGGGSGGGRGGGGGGSSGTGGESGGFSGDGGGSGGGGGDGGGGSGGFGGDGGGSGGGGGGGGGGSGSGGGGSGGGRGGVVQRGGSSGGKRQQHVRCPYVIRRGDRAGQKCGKFHTQHRCFSRLDGAWRTVFGDEAEPPRWLELLRSGVDIFALDYDAILVAMYALSVSAEDDCYLCVLPDLGIEAATLGASESALPGTAPTEALHTFTLDSGASRCFFRDSTTLTPLPASVPVRLADPSEGPILAHSSTVLPCPAVPSGSLSGLHLPSFSTNLVSTAALHDAIVTTTTPGGQCVSICTCTRMGRHLATFNRRPVSGLYTLTAAPPQDRERYFLLVVDDYTRYTTVFPLRSKVEVRDDLIPSIRAVRLQLREQFREDLPVLRLHSDRGGEFSSDLLRDFCHGEGILQSFTLPASPQKNGIAERRIGLVMEVAHTSMIHADAPHFLWPFAVQYAAHQLNLWPRVSLPETSPTLRWTGEVGDASVFTTPPHAVSSSLRTSRPPPVDPLPPQGPAPSGVSQVDPLPLAVPVEVAVDSGAARGAASGGAACGGAASGGAEHASAECMGAESEGAESRGAEPRSTTSAGGRQTRIRSGAAGSGGSAAGGTGAGGAGAAGPGGARTSGTGAAGAGGVGGAGAGDPGAGGVGAGDPGAGGTSDGGAGAGGTGARGAGASSPGGAGVAAGAGGTGAGGTGARDPGPGGAGAGGAGAGDPGAGGTGAGGAGAGGARAGGTRAGGIGAGGAGARGAKAGDPGAGGAGAGGAGAGGPGAGGTLQQCPFFVPPQPSSLPPSDSVLRQVLSLPSSTGLTPSLLCPPPHLSQPQLQPDSPLPAPPYGEQTDSLTERREPESRPASPVCAVCTGRRVPRPRPPPVPSTHIMALRPSSVPLRDPLPSPPVSSLRIVLDPESDLARAASPTVPRLLAIVVTDRSFESTATSALVAELVGFAAACRLDYATSLVAEFESDCPSSIGGECALGTDVLEDRQEDFECLAAAVPHLVAMLLVPKGDPDAPDIPTPRSYAEAIMGPYSSQWQTAMDIEMASWKSTGTYVDAVPPSRANIVDGMWIFRLKRPPGYPFVFKARNVARGFSQRKGVDFFQTFSSTPKMTTLRVLLHVAAQRDYELHSLDFSTTFLQGSLHEEIWLRRPPGFTGSMTLAALGFAPSTADPLLFLRTDTSFPPFYVLVYIDNLVFATADTEALALVLQRFGFWYSSPQSTPLPTGYSLSAPPSDESVEPSGPYLELVGCLMYLMTCTRPDLAEITLSTGARLRARHGVGGISAFVHLVVL
ncbi:unnamed protein product, partial [Closterium sp. NIES-53]